MKYSKPQIDPDLEAVELLHSPPPDDWDEELPVTGKKLLDNSRGARSPSCL
jgi:hypothetical protein